MVTFADGDITFGLLRHLAAATVSDFLKLESD